MCILQPLLFILLLVYYCILLKFPLLQILPQASVMAEANTDTDILKRGILVTDIPYITDEVADLKDKLEIHFQNSKKGGGGEVESIVCRVKGDINKAIVIFKSIEGMMINIEGIKVNLIKKLYQAFS